MNAGGRLVVRATRVGADTQLAQMARLVEQAQSGKAAGAAAGRPGLRGVRARRARRRACSPSSGWLLAGGVASAAVDRRRRGAGHRLPVRARPGDADRAAGRHRPRRAARHPDPGPEVLESHPPGRHRRPGQDRHRHHRPDDGAATSSPPAVAARRRCCGWPARSSTRSEHPVAPGASPRRAAPGRRPAGRDGLREPRRARRARHASRAATSGSGRRSWLVEQRSTSVARRPALPLRPTGRAAGPHGRLGRLGRCARRASSSSPTRSRPSSAAAVAALRQLGLRPVLLTGDNRRAACAVADAGRHRRARGGRGAARRTRSPSSQRLQAEGASWRWSATASTTRPRSRPPTSGWRWAPAPTSRSRPPT